MVNNIDVEIFFKHCRTNLVMHDVIYDFIAYVFFFFVRYICKGSNYGPKQLLFINENIVHIVGVSHCFWLKKYSQHCS